MPQLISPNLKYKSSYLAAIEEYQAEALPFYQGFRLEQIEADFEAHLGQLQDQKTTWWLVENNEYLGRVTITGEQISYDVRPSQRRKGYGKLILKLGLEKSKKDLGLDQVLITCDVNNVGSNKIIQANGGVLDSELKKDQSTQDSEKNKYWFNLE